MDFERIAENLRRNNMAAVICETKEQAKDEVQKLLFDGANITSGGTMTLEHSGIGEMLRSGKYNFLDRNNPKLSNEEKDGIYKKCVGIDFYFCSANALTENGELINVDGFANRVASIAFGPKKVIAIVGKNKIVKDVNEGFLRVKTTAAPLNAKRLKLDTPCAKIGKCISLTRTDNPAITDGCDSKNRICCDYAIWAMQRVKDRITVILVNEDLGF